MQVLAPGDAPCSDPRKDGDPPYAQRTPDNCEREIHGVSYFPAMCHDETVTMETISASSKNEELAEVRPCFLDEAVTDMAWQVSTSSCTPDLISPPGLASGVESP